MVKVPKRGDIVLLNFSPKKEHEQAGFRPVVVLSPSSYNEKVGLALVCPITKKEKGYPFEVKIPDKLKTKGVILSDHVKSLDWLSRSAKYIEQLPKKELNETLEKLNTLLFQ